MDLKELIWIIPGAGLEKYGLEDGKIIGFSKTPDAMRHIEILNKIREEHHLPMPSQTSEMGYAKVLCGMGITLLYSLGRIEGFYLLQTFLPEQLTEKQIEALISQKELLETEFYHSTNLFKTSVYTTSEESSYKLKEGCFRDLAIEAIIAGAKESDGQTLLYQEIASQKENMPRKK